MARKDKKKKDKTNKPKISSIKGYLPVKIEFPDNDFTFCYVKEHRDSNNNQQQPTLFVVNVPRFPGIDSKRLLRSVFGEAVRKVTIVSHLHPTQQQQQQQAPTFLTPPLSPGSFAHVVMESTKDLQRTLSNLEQHQPVRLDAMELEALQHADDDDDGDTTENAVLRAAQRYRQSLPDPDQLLADCNAVMEQFEDRATLLQQERARAAAEPDEDGFVTVTYQNTTTSAVPNTATGKRRRGGTSRQRTKKKRDPVLHDFYRFQTKQERQTALHELRQQFQQDLAKVEEQQKKNPVFG